MLSRGGNLERHQTLNRPQEVVVTNMNASYLPLTVTTGKQLRDDTHLPVCSALLIIHNQDHIPHSQVMALLLLEHSQAKQILRRPTLL